MAVSGTNVSVQETADGIALSFTTTGDVAELRQRVRAMAEKHEQGMSGEMGSGGGGMMVPSTARVEDVDGGARISFTPNDPAQLAELRDHVREHAAHMASGHCPMMGDGG
ncbi:MAG TPA: hypothetical protein VN253_26265 [Kofleriaceae bacterium]|nr:hypothetical protein [Kofleriaceae bacterium]